MRRIVNDEALDALFRAACHPEGWLDLAVSDTLLRAVSELVRFGPGSAGGSPQRLIFVKSAAAKERLRQTIAASLPEAMQAAVQAAVIAAPTIAILGYRPEPRREPFGQPPADRREMRACLLQAGLLVLAARALALDCRPLWQFDSQAVDAAFFPEGGVVSEFLCALGYADEAEPLPALPPAGCDACEIL
ncbi:MAG: hypothetical protein ACM3JG_01920 [Thiohalocapsa sp.]